MLDNVIDLSKFPVEKVNQTFRANRRIGLGIMGYVIPATPCLTFANLFSDLRICCFTLESVTTAARDVASPASL